MQGVANLKTWLEARLGSRYTLNVFEHGKTVAIHFCKDKEKSLTDEDRKFLDIQSDGMISKNLLTVVCEHHVTPRQFSIDLKVFALEKLKTDQNGFKSLLQEFMMNPLSPHYFLENIQALLAKFDGEIVAKSNLVIEENSQGVIKSGGEFLTLHERRHTKRSAEVESSWKEHGFLMKLSIIKSAQESVRLKYALKISQPVSGTHSTHLSANTLESESILPLKIPSILGGVEFQSEKKGTQSIPILDQIPIIAPIFRLSTNHKADMEMFLWVNIIEVEHPLAVTSGNIDRGVRMQSQPSRDAS
jgi:type II secretory pathway component GspD/PulD (secretin)